MIVAHFSKVPIDSTRFVTRDASEGTVTKKWINEGSYEVETTMNRGNGAEIVRVPATVSTKCLVHFNHPLVLIKYP